MKGQQQEKNQRIQEICSPVEDSDCTISHGRSFLFVFFRGLHNAAFSERTTCAGAWDEARCHELLVLRDKREYLRGRTRPRLSLTKNLGAGCYLDWG